MTGRGYKLLVYPILLALLVGMTGTPAAAAGERWCPPETGFCSENAFYDFWRTHGALEILGYPIDQPRRTPNGQVVQFYERAVMEWHPENGTEYQVLLTRLGALLAGDDPLTRQAPVPCDSACTLFNDTNHTLRSTFLNYWQSYGGLSVYGFPITEQFEQQNAADGKTYTVQYFERNRFEYHPENAGTRYEVQLGRLGAELLEVAGSGVRSWPVASVPNYGGSAAPPPPAPTPTPQPPPPTPAPTPAPATPVVTVSPTSGPAGTKFIASGANFPAGATVSWSLAYGGAAPNTGTFQLDHGSTAFNFTVSTDGSPPGAYSIAFSVGGRATGSANSTVTAPPASAGAAQFKNQATAAIDRVIPKVQEVLNNCTGRLNPLVCQSTHDQAKRAVEQAQSDIGAALKEPTPSSCGPLANRVGSLLENARLAFAAPFQSTGPSGFIDQGVAYQRGQYALQQLNEAKRIIAQEPGDCR